MAAHFSPHLLRYGANPSQYAELYLPSTKNRYDVPLPVVVVIHGGFWRQRYGIELARPLAADLVSYGVAALAVEYRRWGVDDAGDSGTGASADGIGAGVTGTDTTGTGGWPRTLDDVAAAVDALATLGQDAADGRLDLGRVVAVGHSAGGQLAAWLAHRGAIPASETGAAEVGTAEVGAADVGAIGPDSVSLRGAVSQAGVLDLAAAVNANLGDGAVESFMGAPLAADPDRYRHASPISYVGDGARVICIHGEDDDTVPLAQSERYVAAARAAGDSAELIALPGVGHMDLIDPTHPAWAVSRDQALALTQSTQV